MPHQKKLQLRTALSSMARTLPLLKWAISTMSLPYPHQLKTDRLCQFAARHGSMDVLRFARDNGCPWETVNKKHDYLSTISEGEQPPTARHSRLPLSPHTPPRPQRQEAATSAAWSGLETRGPLGERRLASA